MGPSDGFKTLLLTSIIKLIKLSENTVKMIKQQKDL